MPRQARLDAPGLLQHVMARGIERRKLFRDNKDRKSFLNRLAIILEETQTQCYAWSLIPNHFHLLLRTGPAPLSKVMRRLMTGYAVTFNKRHKRSGHLFQNRYKSVACEEDPYLLELIRYIHLNPLRAKVVKDLKDLDKYLWTGYSGILGRRQNPLIPSLSKVRTLSRSDSAFNFSSGKVEKKKKNPVNPVNPVKTLAEKTIQDVLLFFSSETGDARRRYRHFVKQGVDQGTRPELQGGGLVRSAGGDKRGLLGRKKEERDPPASPERAQTRDGGLGKGDERILGSGDFVTGILKKSGESFEMQSEEKLSLDLIIDTVTKHMGVTVEDLKCSSRKRNVVHARSIVTYAAVRGSGYKGSEVAEVLSLSRPTISACVEKGKIFLDNNKALRLELQIT